MNRTGELIACHPNGTYDDGMCPVCGGTKQSLVCEWGDTGSHTVCMVCNNCGSEYMRTYRLSTIYIERDGRN